MRTGNTDQIANQLRNLPTLICEMQLCGGSLHQIYRMLDCRCQEAADFISQLNHSQNHQRKRRMLGGGVRTRVPGAE